MISRSELKVVHLTSVHRRRDIRIFLKECRSLASAGYQVSLVVADGAGDEDVDGVRIVDTGKPQGKFDRMLKASRRVYKAGLMLDGDVYHLHDPELLPYAAKLKGRGKRVIFDAHEDLPKQIHSKAYLNAVSKWFLYHFLSWYEMSVCRKLDYIVTATPAIKSKFESEGIRAKAVNNYPLIGELSEPVAWDGKQDFVCYVGGITRVRGLKELVRALTLLNTPARLLIAGQVSDSGLEDELKAEPGWAKVDDVGFVDRKGVAAILSRSIAGMVTFLPSPNHLEAQPNKMFEYMSAGIPVIASHFPLWREIIEGNDCGLCVDPENSQAIADAIDYLSENKEEARRLGENGLSAVTTLYNWEAQEQILLSIYDGLFKE